MIEDVEDYDGTAEQREYESIKQEEVDLTEISFREMVESDLDGWSEVAYNRRWPTILRYLASQYKMSPAQFERAAPWAEPMWRSKSADYRRINAIRRRFMNESKPPDVLIFNIGAHRSSANGMARTAF